MFRTFTTITDFNLFLIITVFLTLISVAGILLVKRFIPLEIRSRDNAVIGNISALISIIYGVLVGLMALYLMNNISYSSDAVLRESNSLADIYRDSKWLSEPTRTNVQKHIKQYIMQAINVEWPQMRIGESFDRNADTIIEKIANELIHYSATTTAETLLLHDMLDEIKALFDARHKRIQLSFSELNSAVWMVIIIGTILILMINYFYAVNFYVHLWIAFTVALMASSMIYLLLTLDRPFQGDFVVEPNVFKFLQSYIESEDNTHITPITKPGINPSIEPIMPLPAPNMNQLPTQNQTQTPTQKTAPKQPLPANII